MANTKISQAAAAAALDAFADLYDAGVSAGYIEVRSGTQPATVGTAPPDGALLGTCTLSDPAFGAATVASPSVATANAISDDTSADNSGTASWFRAYDSDGTAISDGDISGTAGGGDMELDDVNIVAGGTISVNSWTINMPTA